MRRKFSNCGTMMPDLVNFRPDSGRMVSISGPLTKNITALLIPAIRSLMGQSTHPITIFIRSVGGSLDAFHELAEVLNPTADMETKPKIATVAHAASSAAAYVLTMGDPACVFNGARLVFHGARYADKKKRRIMRQEVAQTIAMYLDQENRKIAKRLAVRVFHRLAARGPYKTPVQAARIRPGGLRLDADDLMRTIGARLSAEKSRKILDESLERWRLVLALSRFLPVTLTNTRRDASAARSAQILRAAIAYELHPSGSGAPFDADTTTGLMMDYLLICDLMTGEYLPEVKRAAVARGFDYLGPAEQTKYARLQNQSQRAAQTYLWQATRLSFLGLYYFSRILCLRLLEGESILPAFDAYWLGLVDTVVENPIALPTEMSAMGIHRPISTRLGDLPRSIAGGS